MPSIDQQRRSGFGRAVLRVYRDREEEMPVSSPQQPASRLSHSARRSESASRQQPRQVESFYFCDLHPTPSRRQSSRNLNEQQHEERTMIRPAASLPDRGGNNKKLPKLPPPPPPPPRPPLEPWRMQSSSIPDLRRAVEEREQHPSPSYAREGNQSLAHFPPSSPHDLGQLAYDVAATRSPAGNSPLSIDHDVWNQPNISRASSSNSRPSLREKPVNVTSGRSFFQKRFGRNAENKFVTSKPRDSGEGPPSSSASISSQQAKVLYSGENYEGSVGDGRSAQGSRKTSLDPSIRGEIPNPKVTALPSTASEMNLFAPIEAQEDYSKPRSGFVGRIKGAFGTGGSQHGQKHKRSTTVSFQDIEAKVQQNLAKSPKLQHQFDMPVGPTATTESLVSKTGQRKRNVLRKNQRAFEKAAQDPFVDDFKDDSASSVRSTPAAHTSETDDHDHLPGRPGKPPYDSTKPWPQSFLNSVRIEPAPRLSFVNPLRQHSSVMDFAEAPPDKQEEVRLAMIENARRAAMPPPPQDMAELFKDQLAFARGELAAQHKPSVRHTMSLPDSAGPSRASSPDSHMQHSQEVEYRSASLDSPRADQTAFPDIGQAMYWNSMPAMEPRPDICPPDSRRRGMALEQSPLKRAFSTSSRWEFDASAATLYTDNGNSTSRFRGQAEQDEYPDDSFDNTEELQMKLKHLSMIPELNENRRSDSDSSKRRWTGGQLLESPLRTHFSRTSSRGESQRDSGESNAPSLAGSMRTLKHRRGTTLSVTLTPEERDEIAAKLYRREDSKESRPDSGSKVMVAEDNNKEKRDADDGGDDGGADGGYEDGNDDDAASDFSIASSFLEEADHYCEHEEPQILTARAVEIVHIGRARLVDIPPRRNKATATPTATPTATSSQPHKALEKPTDVSHKRSGPRP